MAKTCKKSILLVILTLCVTACIGLFVACGGNDDPPASGNEVTYTVTVKTDETTAASGVNVTIKKGGASFDTQATDADGKATFSLPADDYEVALSSFPAHYGLPENANLALTAETRELTITLARNFAYTVNLVNADNTPFYQEGVQVGICTLSGNCLAPVLLEQSGVAYIEEAKGDYHVQILDLDGYIYEQDEHGYYTGENFSEEITEMTITVYPVKAMGDQADEMTEAEKLAYQNVSAIYGYQSVELPAYAYENSIAAEQSAYYSYTPAVTGRYYFYSVSAVNYYYDGETFTVDSAVQNQLNTYSTQGKTLEAGKTYYFKAYNPSESETVAAKLVVATPLASYIELNGLASSYTTELTVLNADANAVVALTPTAAAKFTATVDESAQVKLTCGLSEPDATTEHTSDGYTAGATSSAKLTTRKLGYTLYFTVQVQAESYPATVSVTLTKDADITDTETVKTVTETLAQQSVPANKQLKPVPMDGTAQLVYNETDKSYHLGSADGAQVVVNITNASPSRLSMGALAYLDQDTTARMSYVLVEETTALTTGDIVTDYREFIRGFKDYVETVSPNGRDIVRTAPETLTQNNCYAAYVDENGCYPLTRELETFIKALYNAYPTVFDWNVSGGTAETRWLFACYYYDDVEIETPPVEETDVIVGEYEGTDSMGDVWTLTVNADGTYHMESDWDEIDGTWEKNDDDTYTFSYQSYETISYIVIYNEDDKTYEFYDVDPEVYDVYYTFAPAREVASTLFNADETAKIELYTNGTFALSAFNPRSQSFDSMTGGTYTQNADGIIALTFTDTGYGETYSSEYNAQNGTLTVTVSYGEGLDGETFVFICTSNGDDNNDDNEPDPIIGEYEGTDSMGDVWTLTVNADGTYNMSSEWGDELDGTWENNDDDTYTFVYVDPNASENWDASMTYVVEWNDADEIYEFYDVDPDVFDIYYTFAPAREVASTLFNADETAKIELYTNGTFALSAFNPRSQSFDSMAGGTYTQNADGSIALTFTDTGYGETYSSEYNAQNGTLTVTVSYGDELADETFVFICASNA